MQLLCVFHNTFPLFLSSNTILVAESGTRGEILTIKSGYMVIKFCDLTIGIYFYFKNHQEIKYEE
jgi:hypothetical protein